MEVCVCKLFQMGISNAVKTLSLSMPLYFIMFLFEFVYYIVNNAADNVLKFYKTWFDSVKLRGSLLKSNVHLLPFFTSFLH